MSLSSQLSMGLTARLTGAADLSTPGADYDIRQQFNLAPGTTAGKADVLFVDRRTLAASATEDLDLAGSLTNALGAAAVFAKVKGLMIRAAAANTNNVVVGAAAGSPWAALLSATGTLTLRPGAMFMVAAGLADATGYAVTAASADLLKLANSGAGTSVTYDIAIIGTSA